MNYKNLLNDYFISKNIDARVNNIIHSDNYITFDILLNDLTKTNKFNTTMQKELKLLLGYDVLIKIDDKITFTINTSNQQYKDSDILKCCVGKSTTGDDIYVSFKNNPHWLVGGSTGSGKSVFLNNIIEQLITNYSNDIELAFIDLKKVEFAKYNNLPLNVCDVCDTLESAYQLLNNLVILMRQRYKKYQELNCVNIEEYNASYNKDRYVICIIDELAELILQNSSEYNILSCLQSILQLGRASGIFLICATQRPSNDVVSGVLKVNFTTRICFKVGNMYDSRTILNEKGAEKLNGNGDGLILKNGYFELIRFQGFPPSKNIDLSHISDNIEYITPIKNQESKQQKTIKYHHNYKYIFSGIAKYISHMFYIIFATMTFIVAMAVNILIKILFIRRKRRRY